MQKLRSISPADPTLDAPLHAAPAQGRCAKVALVQGSDPHLSGETSALLRVRLRAAAMILFAGLGAFLLYRMFWAEARPLEKQWLLYVHAVIVVLLGASSVLLYKCTANCMYRLRWYETIIFLPPIVFFLFLQYDMMSECASRGSIRSPVGTWLTLMFTYAMFIPNSWKRAAAVLGVMWAAPILLTMFMWQTHTLCARLLSADPGFVAEFVMILTIGYVACVYGTHMINTLRHEAYEARRLGQYKLCRLIGSGGMGEVYLAEHQMMKRPVAIKVIRPGKAADPQALARFEREVQATAKLSHWNTIEIFDYGRTEDGTFYYVMEYLPGLSLADLVERHGPLPPARAVHLLVQTCEALAEAHAAGLIHRDIKPGNIFAAQRGGIHDVAKLLDFGLAKTIVANATSIQLTQEGAITGSPLYMSPEQAMGESEPDQRSDIYSLGAVAYYLLTGVPPFDGDKPMKVIIAHMHEDVTPPSTIRPDIPEDLEAIVLKCLAKDPQDRYQDAASLAFALAECSAAGAWTREQAAAWWSGFVSTEQACREAVEA